MTGPLAGIRVVELGFWVAGPGAAGVLADWGADVVKLEPPDGDPMRGMFHAAVGVDVDINPPFELDNRGKRSISINLQEPRGLAIAHQLLSSADVFVTNIRRPALARLGLDYETLRALNRRLVYCHLTGYGLAGEDADRPAYDIGAYWSRAGVAWSLTAPGHDLPQQRGGMGDHTAALSAVGAICAALVARQQTGEGQLVTTSLLRTGMYVLGWDLSIRLRFGTVAPPTSRQAVPNPVINCYRSGDDRWFWLLGLQGDRHWPDLVRALAKPELAADPKFCDMRARRENVGELVALLDGLFAQKTFSEWTEIFDRENVWWAPVQSPDQVVEDPQVHAAGGIVNGPTGDGDARMVASPADFSETPWQVRAPAPEFAQHGEEILLEMGFSWDEIAELKEAGIIP